MASNPFDDFAQDFGASLPGQQKQAPPPTNSAVGTATANGAAAFSTISFGVQQQMPPSTVLNQPQQFGQVSVSQHYPSQQLPSSAPTAVAMNGTAAPPVQQPIPPSQQPVIGANTSAAGMYFQQPPAQQAHLPVPPQTSSSALVPAVADVSAPSPYASMLGPSPVGHPNVAPSGGVPNGVGASSGSANVVDPFQAGPPPVAASMNPAIDQSNPFAVGPAPGAPLVNVPVAGGASSTAPPFQDTLPGVSGMSSPPTAPGPYSTPPVPPSGPGQFDPISMPALPPAPPNDPFGASVSPPSLNASAGALVPASQPSDDPFGVFATPSAAAAPADPTGNVAPAVASAPPPSSDPWADMGFGPPIPDSGNATTVATSAGGATQGETRQGTDASKISTRTPGELPPGGEWYDARIFTPTLGVMFFKPQELTDSLFLQTDKALVDALDDRPVVAFIVEGSSARSAGVELGHVLLKVNGIDVKNPKEASRLIKEGPRPLPLLFYVPDTTVVVAEGEHMVKYDTRETGAPNSAKDWKPKYVVIGGIIAQPWMMNMYRSKVRWNGRHYTKSDLCFPLFAPTPFALTTIFCPLSTLVQSEYDIAVIETQARRPVSVKVKQFSLQGARIQNDWQGPQMVKYKNKLHPWKYIVVLPVSRNPIKISSPNLSQLKPVHEGIRRVLMAQQRDRGHPSPHTAAPVRTADPYSRNGH